MSARMPTEIRGAGIDLNAAILGARATRRPTGRVSFPSRGWLQPALSRDGGDLSHGSWAIAWIAAVPDSSSATAGSGTAIAVDAATFAASTGGLLTLRDLGSSGLRSGEDGCVAELRMGGTSSPATWLWVIVASFRPFS